MRHAIGVGGLVGCGGAYQDEVGHASKFGMGALQLQDLLNTGSHRSAKIGVSVFCDDELPNRALVTILQVHVGIGLEKGLPRPLSDWGKDLTGNSLFEWAWGKLVRGAMTYMVL